jgi:hypothetical protein
MIKTLISLAVLILFILLIIILLVFISQYVQVTMPNVTVG